MERKFSEVRVWVNGTFDVLHIGHIKLLEFASTLGKVRVGIDTDDRVKRLKGESRPINNLKDRLEFLNSIKYVDSVVDFSTDEELIKGIKEWNPEYLVIGSDYKDKNIIGGDLTKVIFFDRIQDFSTTKIINSK